MKRLACLTLALAVLLAAFLTVTELFSDPLLRTPRKIDDVIIAHYGDSTVAKNVWDMEVLDGRLYISTGDYGKNSGKTPLFVYDISSGEWDEGYLTNDEALGQMRIINGTLYIPGSDSCGGWEAANYYTVTDGKVEIHPSLPNGAHCFDTYLYEGLIYFGIGTVNNTDSPVIAYDGVSYTAVPFYKDGESLFGDAGRAFFRSYNFFSLDGELYTLLISERQDGALMNYEIYRLTDGGFEYYSNLRGCGVGFYSKDGNRIYQNLFKAVTVGGRTLITSGRLFSTADFNTYEEITPKGSAVSDLYAYGDRVFVLTFKETEYGYLNTIGEFKDGEILDICRFDTRDSYALSFAYDGESFFIGTGGMTEESTPGEILKIRKAVD